ncbi:MAG TPA: ACT domain-containing protein [Polyangiaceae bacterium]|nr:ACT domain-containing protein [Polyangiaceae bacterium]
MQSAKSHLVLTAVGPDRPGLVNRISGLIHEAGANLEDSRMAILGGEFALLVLVSGADAEIQRVEKDAGRLEAELGLKVMIKRTQAEAPRNFLPYGIRVTGLDRPGIVRAVAAVLARRGINVASLESRLGNAPDSGTPLFTLEAELEVPSEASLSELRQAVNELANEENLDVVLESGR